MKRIPRAFLFSPLVPILLLYVLLYTIFVAIPYWLCGLALQVAIWLLRCRRGRFVLFVYSNSPNWKEHIESQILPKLKADALVLNWSERSRWPRFSLAAMAFHYFGGSREFNPLTVIFVPFRRTKVLRFWQAFKDYRHGRKDTLFQVENELFKAMRDGLSSRQ